jgi:uncharacterized membrane protein
MMLIGTGAIAQGASYGLGSLTAMGSGFFPVALGVVLTLLGVWIAATAHHAADGATEIAPQEEPVPREWRGWLCILASVAAFVVLGKYGGLLPATFAVVFISALGDRDNTLLSALVLAVAMSIVCVVVFWWALQVQFPLFTWG